jgi:cobalamin biosynthesis Mg chelatase CobN
MFTLASRLSSFLLPVAVAMSVVAISPASPAHAVSAGGWSLEPTTAHGDAKRDLLQYVVAEGQVVHDSVTLSNPLRHPLTVNLYAANAYNIANGGAFALADAADSKTGVATWVSLPISHLTVPARTSARIPVTITVPQQASPGEVSAGIVAQNVNTQLAQRHGNVQVAIREALGVRVYLQVAGPLRPGLEVTDVSLGRSGVGPLIVGGGRAVASYDVMNIGNTRLDATANARIVDEFGHTVHRFAPAPLLALLPGARVRLTDPWNAERVGRFRLVVTVNSGSTTASGQAVMWIVPWLVVLLIVVIMGTLVWWRRRRNRTKSGGRHAAVADSDMVDEPATSDA